MQDITDEILPLLNENGDVIGQIPKSVANSQPGYIHPEVFILLADESGKVLLQKRSLTKKVLPGQWSTTTAGHIALGEEYESAAHRELKEELGFDVPLQYVKRELYELPNETHVGYWYVGKYTGQKIVADPEEVAEVRLFSEKEFNDFFQQETIGIHSRPFIEDFFKNSRSSSADVL